MRFSEVPIGGHFFFYRDDEVCEKLTESTARDRFCAPGFCFEVHPLDQQVDLAVRTTSTQQE